MKIQAFSDADIVNVHFIPIQTVMERLNVRRNYIYKRIFPEVGHTRIGGRAYLDGDSLRRWLQKNATFSRQTVWVKESDVSKHEENLPPEFKREKFGYAEEHSRKRSDLPFRSVKPFDFWDEELIHPALVVPNRYRTEEILYREMFLQGAIKITLGKNKTMFYLERKNGSVGSILMPAIDEAKPQKKDESPAKGRPVENPVDIIVSNCLSENDADEIINFFGEHKIKILQFLYDRDKRALNIKFNLTSEKTSENAELQETPIPDEDIPF